MNAGGNALYATYFGDAACKTRFLKTANSGAATLRSCEKMPDAVQPGSLGDARSSDGLSERVLGPLVRPLLIRNSRFLASPIFSQLLRERYRTSGDVFGQANLPRVVCSDLAPELLP